MQVIIHAGVHCTDDDSLLRTLRRNVDVLRQNSVMVPGPGKYRRALSEILVSLSGAPASSGSRDVMVDQILDGDDSHTNRLILSHPNLFSVPKALFGGGRYYRHAEKRMRNICELFAGDDVELFLGLRDPATFLPSVFDSTPYHAFADFMNGVDPMHLRWSHLLRRLSDEVPQVKLTVWCNEDTPLIWSEVLCRISGLPIDTALTGEHDIFASIMAPEGMKRFQDTLKERPEMTLSQRRRIMVAFLDKYALPDQIEQELDIPGWTDDHVQRLNDIYDDDMDIIAAMPDVTFIEP